MLKIFGAGYLVCLAYQAIRYGSAFSPEKKAGPQHLGGEELLGRLRRQSDEPEDHPVLHDLPAAVRLGAGSERAGKLFFLGALFVLISIPVTAPMVFAADRFAAAMKRSPRVTRAVDYLFAGVFSAFALKILTAQAK